ncbi:MAG: hybrid sensor histidine kinase/response regulator [Deltaproteobacteria bacterium]|nr:hybrid sensor histidine kinase/response regulator [Deltaproteobacteria bacterium]
MRKPDELQIDDGPRPDAIAALAEASRLVGTGTSVSEALRAQLGVLHELTGARTSYVALLDAPRGLLSVIASRGRADPRVRAQGIEEGPLGRAFTTQRPVDSGSELAIGFSRAGEPVGAVELLGIKNRPRDEVLAGLGASLQAALECAHAQEELRQRKAELERLTSTMKALDRQRDEFLGRVSHELKTPLTTVKTYLALLLRHRMGELQPDQERALAIADRNSDRLLRLIDDLLLVSRLSVGQMSLQDKPFGLKQLLEECWATSAKAAQLAQITLEPPQGGELFVRGDREHLRESVLALLDNAIRYNKPGGRVFVRLSSEGATAVLSLGDTGRGMTPETVAGLFEPFDPTSALQVRRKGPASSVVRARQVAQLHGGALEVVSAPDQGTTFTLRLPLFAGMVTAADVHPLPDTQRGGVLLVEDDDDCREGVQELLRAEDIEVAAVATSDEAIAALGKMRPALLLVDLRLREGDGRAVIQHVRATPGLADLPVYVMSGAVSEAASFKPDGPDRIDGFFEKPLNLPRVLAAIRSVIQAEKKQ